MVFDFLKYLQPTHYFQVYRKSGKSIFPVFDEIPHGVLKQLEYDGSYQSMNASRYDLSWQAVTRGYSGNAQTYGAFEKVSIRDNYRFLRKNFHPVWVFYVLVLRLVSFHNPFVEVGSWLQTRKVHRTKQLQAILYPQWDSFHSDLLEQQPKVSVVIPTLNRYGHLKNVLHDFEQQTYTNFELIIVDQSEPYLPEFYKDFNLDIQLIRQEEKALWLARNTAIKNAKGDFIALSEDDVRIQPNWLSAHLKCLDFFNAQVSAGVFYPNGQGIPKDRSFFAVATQFATGNAMLNKNVFKTVGLFDRQFEKQRMGDGEFGMRIYLEGLKSISNPIASCVDVKAGTGGLREMGSWDAFRPSSILAPRPIPSVVYYFRRYFGAKATRLALLRMVPLSILPYQFKKNKPLLIVGLFLSVLLLPLVFYQVWRSWKLAGVKLEEGDLIDIL